MRLIPVLDIKEGVVVRGIGGRRESYRPIESKLTPSVDPVQVAAALIGSFEPAEIYVADLDAITGKSPVNLALYQSLRSLGSRVWIDAGIRNPGEAQAISRLDCDVVIGLETLNSFDDLQAICHLINPANILFSLDLQQGVPLGKFGPSSHEIVAQVFAFGIQRLIVLDLARVGQKGGTGTEPLCQEIAERYPSVDLIAGGGISSSSDFEKQQALGVRGVLVASALHDGRIRQNGHGRFGT